MNRAPLVGEGRIAGDHHEPALLRQRGENVLADPVAEIVLRGIAAHVLEGEHRDRRAIRHGAYRGRAGFHRRKRRCHIFPDFADEAEALARDRLDQPLRRAVVAKRLARGIDSAVQGGIRDDAVAPDLADQVILADHTGSLRDQIKQQIEHLRLQRHGRAAAGQFPQVTVEHVVFKEKSHVSIVSSKNQSRLRRKSTVRESQGVSDPAWCEH
ncbi:AcrR family transcriptional regulator [Bradyrhizobium japonicum]